MRQVIEVMRTLAGVLCVALLMCGCATSSHTLIVDPSQAHDLGHDEGIVFGSVRVEIAPGGERSGRRTAGFNYALIGCVRKPVHGFIDLMTSHPCDEHWGLAVSLGEERTFVVRLPTGSHAIRGLRVIPTWSFVGGEFDIDATYQVTSGEVTYIGRLVLVLPERLTSWTRLIEALVRVEDGLATAQAALGGGYGEQFESPRVEFIELDSNQAYFKQNPQPKISVP